MRPVHCSFLSISYNCVPPVESGRTGVMPRHFSFCAIIIRNDRFYSGSRHCSGRKRLTLRVPPAAAANQFWSFWGDAGNVPSIPLPLPY